LLFPKLGDMLKAMASIYDLKPRFQMLLRPLIGRLAACGCTPNLITSLALLLSIGVGLLTLFARRTPLVLLLLPAWLFLRMALNAIDGMMARELNMKSTLGTVLNEAGDVVSDVALYLPLAVVHPPSLWAVIGFSLGAVMTEFCGVLTQALSAGRHYEGPMGKSDRAFFVGALGLITAFAPGLFKYWPWLFAVAAGLTVLTCVNRLRCALGELNK
jgi:CDP-diacylglycerol--glycerol-3-phosphate 3-phosphatidyltransferase